MDVALRNKTTGEIKLQKIGWSWTCFLFSPVLGIPLFLRKLNAWGGIMIAIWAVNVIAPQISRGVAEYLIIAVGIFLIQCGFMIFFGISGNRMAGKNYLEHGWEFAEGNADATKMACAKWGLPQPQSTVPSRLAS
jgi:hypothetical protein